jgi:zinc transport system ATP-binding protein
MKNNDMMLQVSNLNVKIQDQIILDNVSFKLDKGKTLAIVGPNGAGKTVFFRTLLNMIPYTGRIEWNNKVKIGYVPQRLSVSDVPISVKEFLSFKSSTNMETSLKLVGLPPQQTLNKRLGILSGGQLQRVLIAWAIIDGPDVLLFDEPTTGVDIDSEEAIYKMLMELKEEKEITILLISHEVHIVREYSDYMLALNKCVTFFGESKNIADPDVQRIIYGEPVCLEGLSLPG